MSEPFRRMAVAASLLLALGVASPSAAQPAAATGSAAAASPPPPVVRLWVIAPAARGPWTLRIDNEDAHPIRVPADVRLLRLEIEVPRSKAGKKKVTCSAPPALRPDAVSDARALVLQPGESYVEQVDPHLLCFGSDASALVPNAVVRARFGWDSPPKGSKKRPEGPFAVEGIDLPEAVSPLRELRAPTLLLSHAEPQPAPTKADPTPQEGDAGATPGKPASGSVDAAAPRLELQPAPWSDALSPRSAVIRVTATNAGARPMVAALRSRMLGFRIEGPDGVVLCEHSPPTHAVPRDMYRTLKPRASVDFTTLIREVCPQRALDRPGLYRVTPTFHANESGSDVGLDAFVGTAAARSSTLLRVQSAREPFYLERPKAVPTPKLDALDSE